MSAVDMSAVDKYNARVDAIDSLLCVGLDASLERIPPPFADDPHPQYVFNRHIIAQTHTYAAAYKPNIAFYEARGAAGLNDLARTMAYLRDYHPEIYTICDAKRGDIGSTNEAYTRLIFDELGFDAVTLHPYVGSEALVPFLNRADKGCIILCRTSNEGADELQDLVVDDKPLWHIVAERVTRYWNKHDNCLLVVGATYPDEMRVVRGIIGDMTLLVPGIGAQGGNIQQTVESGLNAAGKGLIINSSRGIIFADDPGRAARALRDEINRHRLQHE